MPGTELDANEQRSLRERFSILAFFSCGIQQPREFTGIFMRKPAATGNFPAGTSHHGN